MALKTADRTLLGAVVLLPVAHFAVWPHKPPCDGAGFAAGPAGHLARCAGFQNRSLHGVQSRTGAPQ